VTVVDNERELQYELRVDGERAGLIRYRRLEGAVALVHTEVDPDAEGHGLGTVLVQGALDDLRARGLKVVPVCPFVAAFIRRHPEYDDLVTADDAVPE
jgi:predicted GNAT family acetyltransferase